MCPRNVLPWHNEDPKWQSVNSLELHLIDKICGFSNTTAACLVIYLSNVGYLQVPFGFLQLDEASTTCQFPIRWKNLQTSENQKVVYHVHKMCFLQLLINANLEIIFIQLHSIFHLRIRMLTNLSDFFVRKVKNWCSLFLFYGNKYRLNAKITEKKIRKKTEAGRV